MDDAASSYALHGDGAQVGRRHELLGALFDTRSVAILRSVGLSEGWRCWEVGAGGSDLLLELARIVGPTGFVLGTDIDIAAMPSTTAQLEVRRHDVTVDPLPASSFDLIHARLVLVHLTTRRAVLSSLISALRPGGWLVIEDADPGLQPLACIDPTTEAEERANTIRAGFRALLANHGADLAFGRSLPRRLREAGLEEVRADAAFPITDSTSAKLELLTLDLVGHELQAAGIVTADELESHRAAVRSGTLDLVQPPLISAVGRRPHEHGA